MSVLIKGMKMPKNCLECVFYRTHSQDYDYCCISSAIPKGYIPADCPLIELSDHGDLIDSDEVEECPMKNEVKKTKLIKNAWWLISGLIASPDDYSADYKLGYIEGVVHTIELLLLDDIKVNPDYIVDGLDEEEE